MKVLIDPGHGGPFTGAVAGGVRESDVNLSVALQLHKVLKNTPITAWLTRDADYSLYDSDRFTDISRRAKMAGDSGADLLLSLHCNNFSDPAVSGMEVWTTVGQNNSDVVAEEIINSLVFHFPERKLRADTADGDRDREKDYNIIKEAPCKAVLVEMEFLSNPEARGWLKDLRTHWHLAQALAAGIHAYRIKHWG